MRKLKTNISKLINTFFLSNTSNISKQCMNTRMMMFPLFVTFVSTNVLHNHNNYNNCSYKLTIIIFVFLSDTFRFSWSLICLSGWILALVLRSRCFLYPLPKQPWSSQTTVALFCVVDWAWPWFKGKQLVDPSIQVCLASRLFLCINGSFPHKKIHRST